VPHEHLTCNDRRTQCLCRLSVTFPGNTDVPYGNDAQQQMPRTNLGNRPKYILT